MINESVISIVEDKTRQAQVIAENKSYYKHVQRTSSPHLPGLLKSHPLSVLEDFMFSAGAP